MQILARLVEEKVDIYKVIKRISCGINQSREESEDNKGNHKLLVDEISNAFLARPWMFKLKF